jgi:hypothetical protein
MTEEQFLSLCKPGVTLEDFKPRKLTPEEDKEWAERLRQSRERQKESLRRKYNIPFKNHVITI